MHLAIKLPNDLYDRILSFPVLHAIWRVWESLEKESDEVLGEEELFLHLICDESHIDGLNLLPMQAYYHDIKTAELTNVFSMHRAIKNSKMNHVDIFVNCTTGFVDSSIGKNLGAKKRIGFENSKNNIFLTDKVPYQEGRHFTEILRPLIEKIWDKPFENFPRVSARNVEPYFSDWKERPYIVINIKGNLESTFNKELFDFISLFKKYRFVIMCEELAPTERDDFFKQLFKDFTSNNSIEFFSYESWIDFAKLVSPCKCFITFDGPLALFATYCEAHTYWINQEHDVVSKGPDFFRGECRIFDCKGKQEDQINFSEIFDEVYDMVAPAPIEEDVEDEDPNS